MIQPEVTKTIPLGELIDRKQFSDLRRIMKDTKDSSERVRKINNYLEPATAELESKGVLVSYLSYYLEYLHIQGMM